MLIELARYTFLFALTAVGLQTFLLCPTLWSGGSAITIKLGFRGACFTTALLLFTFFILLYCFVVHDFSLAVVFENFDSQSSLFYAFQAFCASREGFFFTFIIALSTTFLINFSKKELATYQERGRYLFSNGSLIFALSCLMLTTADPFVRIENPPFEGIGFNPLWRSPYRILFVLFSFAACSQLTVSFIKTICMYSKGRQFVAPALRDSLRAFLFLLFALGIKIATDFTTDESAALWMWSSENALLSCVLLFVLGQILLLFFCGLSCVFTNWILVFSLLSTAFANALFLTREYRLFTLSTSEVYFPNPIIALYAFAGLFCFLLFLCSVTLKKPFKERSFSTFSRESFIGLTAAALLSAGISIGTLALLPALFMFLPDLPLRLLPNLLKTTLFWLGLAAAIFFFIAFKRKSFSNEWTLINKKNTLLFWAILFSVLGICCYAVPNGYKVVLHSAAGIFIFASFFDSKTIKIPSSFQECLNRLKKNSTFKYALIFCVTGFLIFSVALSYASFNRTETKTAFNLETMPNTPYPCTIQKLSEKNETFFAKYRLVCEDSIWPLSGSLNFQWQETPLKAKFLQTRFFSVRLFQINQNQENALDIRMIDYPALQLVGTGLLLMCLGVSFLLLSIKTGGRA